jgi:hypothetical protein
VRGTVATLPLVPAVVDAVSPTPVVAAGGIADGRGLAAVLALGALGAWIGTRFLASEEATIHPRYRERLLEADENDTTYFEELFDVRWPKAPHRTLRNKTVELWESAGRPQSGRRPGEGEVIARSPTSGDIVRYQSYTPGPMPKEISTRCRSGRAKASVSSRRFSPRPRSFARSSTKQGRSSTGLQFSGSAAGQSCVRTTSRRFEFPSLRQRVVVSPEISTLTTAKAELLDPVGVEQRRCRRTISQGYRKRQDILEGGHGAATRARLPDPRAFAHRSHHVPRPINDQLRD